MVLPPCRHALPTLRASLPRTPVTIRRRPPGGAERTPLGQRTPAARLSAQASFPPCRSRIRFRGEGTRTPFTTTGIEYTRLPLPACRHGTGTLAPCFPIPALRVLLAEAACFVAPNRVTPAVKHRLSVTLGSSSRFNRILTILRCPPGKDVHDPAPGVGDRPGFCRLRSRRAQSACPSRASGNRFKVAWRFCVVGIAGVGRYVADCRISLGSAAAAPALPGRATALRAKLPNTIPPSPSPRQATIPGEGRAACAWAGENPIGYICPPVRPRSRITPGAAWHPVRAVPCSPLWPPDPVQASCRRRGDPGGGDEGAFRGRCGSSRDDAMRRMKEWP